MADFVMTDEERQLLESILEELVSDLRMEIASTDRQDFRDDLKRKKVLIQKVLESVRVQLVHA